MIRIKEQNYGNGIVYTLFQCGCEAEDNRKRMFVVTKNCGQHTEEELRAVV